MQTKTHLTMITNRDVCYGKKKMSLALQIFIALVLAIIAGLILGINGASFANNYIKPFGTIFLNLVKFIVCPIVLVSIINEIIWD